MRPEFRKVHYDRIRQYTGKGAGVIRLPFLPCMRSEGPGDLHSVAKNMHCETFPEK